MNCRGPADQRGADAFAEAMLSADTWFAQDQQPCPSCGTPVPRPTGSREPLTNLMLDGETLRWWLSGIDEPAGPIDEDRIRRFVSGTSDGHPIPLDDVVRRMILGRVRVLVRDSDGTITDVGKTQRFFRGRQRVAALLHHPTCIWPGCDIPASRCQADHIHPHGEGGATTGANGGPLCDFHNRFKAKRSYRTIRGPDGNWHILRLDGTDITGGPAPPQREGSGAA